MSVRRQAAVVAGLLTAAIVLVHAPRIAELFGVAEGDSCPLGYGGGSALARSSPVSSNLAGSSARTKPALGFGLAHTRSEDLQAWAQARGGQCTSNDQALECGPVPFANLGDVRGTLIARFDAANKLNEVVGIIRLHTAEEATQILETVAGEVERAVGQPTFSSADKGAEHLRRGALAQSATEFNYNDYYARIAATHMNGSEYLVTQTYRALPATQ